MQKPRNGESARRLRRRVLYHSAQLEAEPKHAELLPPNLALLERLDAFAAQEQSVRDTITRALAGRDRKDRAADQLLRSVDLALLGLVNRDRDDSRYVLAYEGKTMSAIMRLSILDEVKALRHLASLMDADGPLAPLADAYQANVQQAADGLEAAEQALVAALDARAKLSTTRTLLRLDVTRVFEKDYADLLQATPHDKDEVELYFFSFSASQKVEEEDDI